MTRRVPFDMDKWAIALLGAMALALAGWRWLAAHPQHNPWAPLRLEDPPGWATAGKIAHLREAPAACPAFLSRSEIAFRTLPVAGEGPCLLADRTIAAPDIQSGLVLRPSDTAATCAVQAGLALWLRHGVQPAALELLGSRVVAIEHLGTGNCRRIAGASGGWSEHATANAIDVAAFVLADGRRISVLRDWSIGGRQSRFLRRVRHAACADFSTTLSPDYNAAHRDHLHLDQARRRVGRVCR